MLRHLILRHPIPMRLLKVAGDVNGPLLELLAAAAGWQDVGSIEFFRTGAPLFGILEKSGVGIPCEEEAKPEPDRLLKDLESRNAKACSYAASCRHMPPLVCNGRFCRSSKQMSTHPSSCRQHATS